MRLDLRLEGARVLTMDPARPYARSIGIWGEWIAGLDEEIDGLPAARVVDLHGATVLPGFVDAHTHLAWAGLAASSPRIPDGAGAEDALAVVRRALADTPQGAWVDVAGYDARHTDRPLSAADLDRVSTRRPIYVQDRSGHACVVNSAVLDRLPAALLAPGAAGVDIGADGRPSGRFSEAAQTAVRALRPPHSVAELERAVTATAHQCLAEGVTLCAEAGIGAGLIGHSPVELAAYQRAAERGALPIRAQLMVAADALHPVRAHPDDGIRRGLDLGLRTGLGDHRLSIGALKVFLDGGMMARTAALTEPYCLDGAAGSAGAHGREGALGLLQDDPDALRALVVDAHTAGWQLALHAIGDRAVDLALDAFDAAARAAPRPDARHRIEHCGLVRPDQLPRLAAAGVVAVVQPSFLWAYGDDYATVMGEARSPWMYRGRALLDHGVPLAGSSDRPVACGAPLRAIQFMVERTSSSGRAIGPDEAITVDEALAAYTRGGAVACRREHLQGTLAAGRLADLVVLAEDPRRVETSRIARIEVLATCVGGATAFASAASPLSPY